MSQDYGDAPVHVANLDLGWTEFMRYLYLPVRMRWIPGGHFSLILLPDRLEFLRSAVEAALVDAVENFDYTDPYVYVSAHRGYATPDNPLNRPGWHCDGFGTDDLNYVWWDRWPSRFALQRFDDIDPGHVESMRDFENQIRFAWVRADYPSKCLYRLTPFVVHTTPIIATPGGMRSFLKVSVSNHRYNLIGNSHNHLFDYAWPMHERAEVRNDPALGEADYFPDA